jgi:hypothetical protein
MLDEGPVGNVTHNLLYRAAASCCSCPEHGENHAHALCTPGPPLSSWLNKERPSRLALRKRPGLPATARTPDPPPNAGRAAFPAAISHVQIYELLARRVTAALGHLVDHRRHSRRGGHEVP